VATKSFVKKDFEVEGVELIGGSGKSISLKVHGEIGRIIKVLASYDLTDLEVSHANLEDVFMEYY